jgi:signal transduction histidine kinase
MQSVLATHGSRIPQAIRAILHYEPKVLRGLSWRHLGYAELIALVLSIRHATFDLYRGAFPSVNSLSFTWLNSICGLSIVVLAVMLTNLERPRIARPVAVAIAVVAGCILAASSNTWLWQQPTFPRLRVVLLEWGLVAAVYWFMERSARRDEELRKAELDRHRLEAQMLEARLQVLQAQVEPHFLFNTLAHVQQLYQTDPARGRLMLDSFCDYVRSALPRMRSHRSTLTREVDLARSYLATQRIRMGRRLQFGIAIPEDLLRAAFPPMMLLSLVENAIKHGLSPLREGGSIRIFAELDAGVLRVTVADTGAGLSAVEHGEGSGIGLSNIRSRLATLYGATGRLTLARNEPQGLVATIELPFDSNDSNRIDRADAAGAPPSQPDAGIRRVGAAG